MTIYVVKQGDTVDKIASEYAIDPGRIIYINQLSSPYPLAIGQALLIPVGESANLNRDVYVNGYAYPFISRWVLNETLPYLSSLSVFSYGFTIEGELLYPPLNDEFMIQAAVAFGVLPILTLTPFGVDGKFNNALIHELLINEEAKERLFNELLTVMESKGFRGLDIDFEFILAEDRDRFTEFARETTERMNAYGYTVSVDLAPKTSSDQPGLLYEGKDYAGLGAAANHVLVMTYEWGYTYGPPMAVAPIVQVRNVLEYAITQIPPDKINMGIPNYGYDWPLPYERGVTRARTIGNVEAVQLAITYGVPIQYDQASQTPFFRYRDGDIEHEVWFEDVRSLYAKYQLANELNLRGFGFWQIMQFFRAGWILLSEVFQII